MTQSYGDAAVLLPVKEDGSGQEQQGERGPNHEALLQIAEMLVALADRIGNKQNAATARNPDRQRILAVAESIVHFRQRRQAFFPAGIFGEAAWDILLDLFVAALRGEERLVKQLCLAAQVPSTTALRYVARLEEHGIVRRVSDKVDRRRIYISLTRLGFTSMRELLVGDGVPETG